MPMSAPSTLVFLTENVEQKLLSPSMTASLNPQLQHTIIIISFIIFIIGT